MIEIRCSCSKTGKAPESAVGKKVRCPGCGAMLQIVCAEPLAQGAGLGDFDASLVAVQGQVAPANRYLLGGVADIEIGKLADRQIVLPGVKVSRQHCKLVRVNFGPSCWRIVDNNSTNGIFVNGQHVAERELRSGDVVQIGEFQFQYSVEAEPAPAAPVESEPREVPTAAIATAAQVATAVATGQLCPSCEKALAPRSKICIDCGINVISGRPIITRQGIDENQLYAAAHEMIRWASLLVRVTPLPMPIRSEAFGAKKPYAIWAIAALTTLVSIGYFFVRYPGPTSLNLDKPGTELMLFSPWATYIPITVDTVNPAKVREVIPRLNPYERDELRDKYDPPGNMSDDQLVRHLMVDAYNYTHGQFHWYQLFTHMLLHDPTSIIGFILHLGGNMLFLLVFGTRVNALIGDLATAILYVVLGVCAGVTHLVMSGTANDVGMLGASGAIFGMAGVYLILFPVHRVICAMWIRFGLFWRGFWRYKLFAVRGFWVLLMYFGFEVAMGVISKLLNANGAGVAHWAHIGGFTAGMVIGLGLMFSRQFNARGGDLLSIVLGKLSWPLIGKPSQWKDRQQSIWGTLAFSGGAICLLITAIFVVADYDPRTPAEKLLAGLSVSDGSLPAQPAAYPQPAAGTTGSGNSAAANAPPQQTAFDPSQDYSDTLPDGTSETAMVGGSGGSAYVRADPQKRFVIGFAIRLGQWNGHGTIGRCEPLYQIPSDPVPSDMTICMAKTGYVVSGVIVNKIDGADGLQIVFARYQWSNVDLKDTYTSDWFGDPQGTDQTQLAGHGERVIGTFGRQGLNNDAIGLVIDGKAQGH